MILVWLRNFTACRLNLALCQLAITLLFLLFPVRSAYTLDNWVAYMVAWQAMPQNLEPVDDTSLPNSKMESWSIPGILRLIANYLTSPSSFYESGQTIRQPNFYILKPACQTLSPVPSGFSQNLASVCKQHLKEELPPGVINITRHDADDFVHIETIDLQSGGHSTHNIVVYLPEAPHGDPDPDHQPPPGDESRSDFLPGAPSFPCNITAHSDPDFLDDYLVSRLPPETFRSAIPASKLHSALLVEISSDSLQPLQLLLAEDMQLELAPVSMELLDYLTRVGIPDIVQINSQEDIYPVYESDQFPLQGSVELEEIGYLLQSGKRLLAVAWNNDEKVYVYRDFDGRLRTITQSQYREKVSLVFESQIDVYINGPYYCSMPPEVYRNGYSTLFAGFQSGSYWDWCEANGFSRSDGNAYLRRKTSSPSSLKRHTINGQTVRDVSLEEVLQAIHSAGGKKKRKGKGRKEPSPVEGASGLVNKESLEPVAQKEPDQPAGATPPSVPAPTRSAQSIDDDALHSLLEQPIEHSYLLLFLTGLTPEDIERKFAGHHSTLPIKQLLANKQGALPGETLWWQLLSYLRIHGEKNEVLLADGPSARKIIEALRAHYQTDADRSGLIATHFQYYRLGVLEYHQLLGLASSDKYHTKFWQKFSKVYSRLDETSRIFDPQLKLIPVLELNTDPSVARSWQMLEMLRQLLSRYGLNHYWPLLGFNFGISGSELKQLSEEPSIAAKEGWIQAISASDCPV